MRCVSAPAVLSGGCMSLWGNLKGIFGHVITFASIAVTYAVQSCSCSVHLWLKTPLMLQRTGKDKWKVRANQTAKAFRRGAASKQSTCPLFLIALMRLVRRFVKPLSLDPFHLYAKALYSFNSLCLEQMAERRQREDGSEQTDTKWRRLLFVLIEYSTFTYGKGWLSCCGISDWESRKYIWMACVCAICAAVLSCVSGRTKRIGPWGYTHTTGGFTGWQLRQIPWHPQMPPLPLALNL